MSSPGELFRWRPSTYEARDTIALVADNGMQPTIKFDTAGIRAMARELAQISGKSYATVLRSEAGSMVKIAALRAKIASQAQIKRDVQAKAGHQFHEPGGSSIVIVDWKRFVGRTWFSYSEGDSLADYGGDKYSYTKSMQGSGRNGIRGQGAYMIYDAGPAKGHRVPDQVWQDFLTLAVYRADYVKARAAELVKRRGLMRMSWLQMGDALGISLSAISPAGNLQETIARGARGPGGRSYKNGTAQETSTAGAEFVIILTNESPLAIKNNGQRALDSAISQRVRGFEIAMQKGVLNDLKLRSARWRGIFVAAA